MAGIEFEWIEMDGKMPVVIAHTTVTQPSRHKPAHWQASVLDAVGLASFTSLAVDVVTGNALAALSQAMFCMASELTRKYLIK